MNIKPIKIAILAMGGEGGGVLADWIVSLGEHNDYVAQTTSVPGVAQRTGATIYYIELFPKSAILDEKMPVLALMPMPGDVDIVLASELMEAGRAVQRGLVTPEQTTLITSSHRVYSINEKSALGDGRVDSDSLIQHTKKTAKQYIKFDMAKVAEQTGSVISAVLFGALAASKSLPFTKQQFEQTIERGGVGVKSSLAAFNQAFEITASKSFGEPSKESDNFSLDGLKPSHPEIIKLIELIKNKIPTPAQKTVVEGVRRLIDYQSIEYAALYLDRLIQQNIQHPVLLEEIARYLALWMSYEDAIRVADLKTRASRFERVKKEVFLNENQLLDINEYMHPRIEEISEILPFTFLANWLLNPTSIGHLLLKKFTKEGKVIKTSSIRGFLLLYLLAKLKRWRPKSLRYQLEQQRISKWLNTINEYANSDLALALEITELQRLVKGYGDTHMNGTTNLATIMALLEKHKNVLSANHLKQLREAALEEEDGKKLQQTIKAIGL